MKIIGQIALRISHRGRTIQVTALVADKLCHEMIISWQDCIHLQVVPNIFPIPPDPGNINGIQNEADAIKETITNKYVIIRDDISHNKILTKPAKVKLTKTQS